MPDRARAHLSELPLVISSQALALGKTAHHHYDSAMIRILIDRSGRWAHNAVTVYSVPTNSDGGAAQMPWCAIGP